MPEIDLGVDFGDVKEMDKFPVVPNGSYAFVVKAMETKKSQASGRPMIKWTLTVKDPDSGNDCNLFHNTVLPYNADGSPNTDGVGMLVAICKAVGMPWTGKTLNTEDYVGRGGEVEVSQDPKMLRDPATGKYDILDPSGDKVNNIKKFIYNG